MQYNERDSSKCPLPHAHTPSYGMINSLAFLQSTDLFPLLRSVVYLPIFLLLKHFFCILFHWIRASCMQLFIFIWYFYFHSSFISMYSVWCSALRWISGRDFGIYKPCNQRTLKDDWAEYNWLYIYVEAKFFLNILNVSLDWILVLTSVVIIIQSLCTIFSLSHASVCFPSNRLNNFHAEIKRIFSISYCLTLQFHFLVEFVSIWFL